MFWEVRSANSRKKWFSNRRTNIGNTGDLESRYRCKRPFINEETYYNIIPEKRPVLERVRTTFLSADGQEINTIWTAKMNLTLRNVDLEQRIFVGGVKKNLLGEDFKMIYKCVWEHDINWNANLRKRNELITSFLQRPYKFMEITKLLYHPSWHI